MNPDIFREESVSKANTSWSTMVYILCFIGMIVFGFIAFNFLVLLFSGLLEVSVIVGLVVTVAITVGLYFLRNNQRLEYDYTFTNGTLDIAKVINNNKRKKLLTTDIKDFEVIAPTSDEGFQRMLNHPGIKKLNYFLNRGGGLYYGVFTHEGNKTLLVFEPSEEIVNLFKSVNPRIVKI